MALVDMKSGCKVGWSYYDDEDEAKRAAVEAGKQRDRMFLEGYDFGYQWPGSTPSLVDHPEHGKVWMIVTP